MSRENGDQVAPREENVAAGSSGAPAPDDLSQQREVGDKRGDAGDAAEGQAQAEALFEELKLKIKELEDENSTLKDQYLRKAADFENFRKRINREREENAKYANASLLSDLIPVIDDFERAARSAGDSRDFDSFHAGIILIEKRLVEMLERKHGLRRFEAVGEVFDPLRHEAISIAEIEPPADSQVVVEGYQKGFMLHDRVLRPATVKVSKEPAPKSAESKEKDHLREKEGE